MTANTGRTTSQWTVFKVDDSNGTLRQIPVSSINGLSLVYSPEDKTAFGDAIMGVLSNTPECVISISGPVDNTANTGSHTVLNAINGGVTPLTLDVQIGVRHAWESGEPQFGITSSSANGFLCRNYKIDAATATYTAEFYMFPGSIAPAWGTAAES
jgi:hypothetical protein